MESDRINNTARNMRASTFFRLINLAFPFFINSIIIKTLGVEYLGLNMLFASILQVLSLTELGFGTAMVFSMYEGEDRTYDQSVNPVIIFSDLYDNLLSSEYEENYQNIASAVLVAGEGE